MSDLEQRYQKALDYLYSFVDYSLTRNLRYSEEKFDLDRMRALMERLGNPHRRYPVVHVAGTKGKGSTGAMVARVLQAAGYKVGFYISPHLEEFTERIQVNRQMISRADLIRMVETLKPHVEVIERLTTFELTTAAGLLYFAEQQVDAAVVEVGLGGRLDATNVVDPLVSVITSLSLDHTQVLGDTLAKIAAEKGGIIKPGRPVVLAPQQEEARLVIERIAAERNAPLVQVGRDVHFAPRQHSLSGQTLSVWSQAEQPHMDAYLEDQAVSGWRPVELRIPLLGYHQVENAATAYAAIQASRAAGLAISAEAVQQGFGSVDWPGRFEVLSTHPMVVVDSAHNRDSARKLRTTIDDYLPSRPVTLVFGASEDKDVVGMFAELLPRVSGVIVTESIHPRAMKVDELLHLAHPFGTLAWAVLPVEQAVTEAIQSAQGEKVVLITGSLFIAAAARQYLRSNPPAPEGD